MQEEIFGPILPVLEFDKLDDALALLRERPTPLALYLFTRDRATQERVLAATRSGGVCLNDTIVHMIGKDLPFGGLGESGMGAYHGKASFDCFTHRRSVLRRSFAFDPKLRYPPPRLSLADLEARLPLAARGLRQASAVSGSSLFSAGYGFGPELGRECPAPGCNRWPEPEVPPFDCPLCATALPRGCYGVATVLLRGTRASSSEQYRSNKAPPSQQVDTTRPPVREECRGAARAVDCV